MRMIYYVIHKDRRVCKIDTTGNCKIYFKSFMPYNLYLEECEKNDIDTLVNNINNFYYWCATRVLTLDRQYAKEIFNSIGVKQAVTDKDRAEIALSYRCLSLTDVYWVMVKGEKVSYDEVNLYNNHLENTFIDISLRGKQYTVENNSLAKDLSTNGLFPKAWRRKEDGFQLLKDGGYDNVNRELLASKICQCFKANQVMYEEDKFDNEIVSSSNNMTNEDYSIVSMEFINIWCQNECKDTLRYILKLDKYNYYMMNVIDYLVGNTDRHWGNWGVLVNNKNNKPVRLHDLMDFNKSFNAYDRIEGANCQTTFGNKMTQKEAAIQGVMEVGLNQIREVEKEWFCDMSKCYEMFIKRLELLKVI